MILIVLAALLAGVAFSVLVRLLWLSGKNSGPRTIVVLAAAGLIVGLAVLTATGRLHWLAALGAALLPFVKRSLSFLRWLPWLRNLYQARANTGQGPQQNSHSSSSAINKTEAREILGLGGDPSPAEVVSAHRRLIQKLHPDRGGSTYLAQQLNEAKRVLLEKS